MSVLNEIDRADAKRLAKATEGYVQLVLQLANGDEPEIDETRGVLAGAGKTTADARRDLELVEKFRQGLAELDRRRGVLAEFIASADPDETNFLEFQKYRHQRSALASDVESSETKLRHLRVDHPELAAALREMEASHV